MSDVDDALKLLEPIRPDIVDILRRVHIEIVPYPCVVDFPMDDEGEIWEPYDMLAAHIHGTWEYITKRLFIPCDTTKSQAGLAYVLVHEGQHALDDAHDVLRRSPFVSEVRGLAAQAQAWKYLFPNGADVTEHIQYDAAMLQEEYDAGRFAQTARMMYSQLWWNSLLLGKNQPDYDINQRLTFDTPPSAPWLKRSLS